MNKKGYAYWVEIILSVVIVSIILTGYIDNSQKVFQFESQQNLKEQGWHVLYNLDQLDLINTSNVSWIETYVAKSFPDTIKTKVEYYNTTGCYKIVNDTLVANGTYCDSINISTKNDIVSASYTRKNSSIAESFRIYMWRWL